MSDAVCFVFSPTRISSPFCSVFLFYVRSFLSVELFALRSVRTQSKTQGRVRRPRPRRWRLEREKSANAHRSTSASGPGSWIGTASQDIIYIEQNCDMGIIVLLFYLPWP
jgi:hypothetical protein